MLLRWDYAVTLTTGRASTASSLSFTHSATIAVRTPLKLLGFFFYIVAAVLYSKHSLICTNQLNWILKVLLVSPGKYIGHLFGI